MKRCLTALVDYEVSDEEESPPPQRAYPRRKLPPLPSSLLSLAPIDNPALHQGRKRTTPHVEEMVPTLHEHWLVDNSLHIELHVSLSRPIFLRAHQREELKRAVKHISRKNNKFSLSFATFAELTNDEKTRTFLAMEAGAGHHEVGYRVKDPTLQTIRQKEFYTEPRFHASIAWALLDREVNSSMIPSSPAVSHASAIDPPITDDSFKFPTILEFPQQLIPTLIERFGATLPVTSAFDVDKIAVKIGKEVTSWLLGAP
ncbi:hypothetical protein BDQ17DRAFT_1321214 [Cyathus striatus]|nr:hypothetical protein BDQ17DRAFT_1321214 [Cyathus striatus]